MLLRLLSWWYRKIFLKYVQEVEDNNIDELINDNEIIELPSYNSNNELVKIFIEKCCICLENDSVYAFGKCGHLSICESCYKNTDSDKLTKCIFCKS